MNACRDGGSGYPLVNASASTMSVVMKRLILERPESVCSVASTMYHTSPGTSATFQKRTPRIGVGEGSGVSRSRVRMCRWLAIELKGGSGQCIEPKSKVEGRNCVLNRYKAPDDA